MAKEIFPLIKKFLGVNLKAEEFALKSPTTDPNDAGEAELRQAKNFDITNSGKLRGRQGYSLKLSLPGAHSGTFFVDKLFCGANSGLCSIHPSTWESTVLVSGLNPNALISWAPFGNRLYWTNGEAQGVIISGVNQEWGIQRPGRVTAAAISTGDLYGGDYQVALTFLKNGEESGATVASKVTVPPLGGIALSNIPQGGDTIRVYVTRQNGDVLFRHTDLPLGTTSFNIGAQTLGKRLMTQFANKPPIGHIVREYNGRLLIARGDTIFYTLPQIPSLCRLSRDFLPRFPSRIKMVRPVEGGFYVDAGGLYFVSFPSAQEPALIQELGPEYEAIEGTDREVPAFWFGGAGGNVGFWWTVRGWPVLGGSGGKIQPLGEDKIAIPKYELGATLLREREGLRQLISGFRFNTQGSNFAVSDSLEATIVTRG